MQNITKFDTNENKKQINQNMSNERKIQTLSILCEQLYTSVLNKQKIYITKLKKELNGQVKWSNKWFHSYQCKENVKFEDLLEWSEDQPNYYNEDDSDEEEEDVSDWMFRFGLWENLAIKQYGVEIILVNLYTMTAKRNGIG